MSIGERLRRLDDRVIGPPRPEAPARRVAMWSGFVALGAHEVARAVGEVRLGTAMSGLIWVVFALAFLGVSVYQDRTGPAPVLGPRLLAWAVGLPAVAGALPVLLVPALRDGWPAIAAKVVAAVAAAYAIDRMVRRAGEAAAGDAVGGGSGAAPAAPPAPPAAPAS